MDTNHVGLFLQFRENANEKNACEMSAYMRDMFPFLGIKKPDRAALQKDFLKAAKKANSIDWAFVNECWTLEREFQYLALDYLRVMQPLLTPDDIPRLRKLAVTKSWWDTVDFIDSLVGDIALRFPEVNTVIIEWSTDENIWLRRIAIDHQLQRKTKTDTALLEQVILNNLGQKEFFINKAIGWALREYSKVNRTWVSDFVNQHRSQLAPLSIREASKYL